MKKEYIRDDGKIRNCPSNIAKMNFIGYIFFDIRRGFFIELFDFLKDGLKGFGQLLLALFSFSLFPIILIIRSVFITRKSRKEVERENYQRRNNEMR